ncbi:alpha/beta hydrolase [Rhodovulum sp. DZ06]|uniref:alpha/beta hydrolase n=1 Tax=Rhodovulum sp. DZ06 TaxID=3425126 RepID=UPI003D3350C3
MLTLDPALFRPEAISEETAAFNAKFEATLAELPATHEIPPEVTRAARDAGKGIFPAHGPIDGSEWRDIPGGRVRITPPPGDKATGVYIHIHGGGWTVGRPSYHDALNQELAQAAGCAVVSLEYRLAPENPWPAGPDDCLNGALWALDHAGAEFGTDRFAIGGESAGGHLSAVTLLRLREAGRVHQVRGAMLMYGAFDLRLTAKLRNWGERKLVLNTPAVEWFTANLTPDAAVRDTPAASPILADLSGMPPALFQVGTMDPLMDDTLQMAARWAGAGLDARLNVWPGGIHAFDVFDIDIARKARAATAAFLREVFA